MANFRLDLGISLQFCLAIITAMRTTLLFVLLICVLASHWCSGNDSITRDLKVITLTGSGYERGLQHGRQLKADVAKIVEAWRDNTRRVTGEDPDKVLKEFPKDKR